MANRISDWIDGHRFAFVTCRRCGHQAQLDLPTLLARHGDLDSDELGRRFRCGECGLRERPF